MLRKSFFYVNDCTRIATQFKNILSIAFLLSSTEWYIRDAHSEGDFLIILLEDVCRQYSFMACNIVFITFAVISLYMQLRLL